MAAWSALALLPDADVIGFAMGVRYADPWGHRGAAHSLAIALVVAGAIAFAARARTAPRRLLRLIAVATLVVASHGLLDTLTDGGLGVALFWPFSLTRYFAPWRPIPVAPIGLTFLSPYGFFVALTELALFAPLLVFAIGWPRVRWGFMAGWAVVAWLVASTDPVRERVLSLALREDTQYAAGFSETIFRRIERGQPIAQIRASAGEPLEEVWFYFNPDESGEPADGRLPPCPAVPIESGHVVPDARTRESVAAMCEHAGVRAGMSVDALTDLLGSPTGMCWSYTRSRSRAGYYRARVVCFESGKVFDVMRRWERG